MAGTFFNRLDRFLYRLNDFMFPAAAGHYCFLETVDGEDDETLVAQDGSLISLIEIFGARAIPSDESLIDLVRQLDVEMSTRLDAPGHLVQVVFDYDPGGSLEATMESISPAKATADRLGLPMGDVLDDWAGAVARHCAAEHVWLAVWTRPSCLTAAELTAERKRRGRAMSSVPLSSAQQPMAAMIGLRDRHTAFATGVRHTLTGAGLLCASLDVHEALCVIRRVNDPASTSPKWRARVPGDPVVLLAQEPGDSTGDLSPWLYPPLADQLFPREAEVISPTIIRIGNHLHAPLMMTMPPNVEFPRPIYPFGRLFNRLRMQPFPWRASFLLGGDGEGSLGIRPALSAILAITSTANKRFNLAVAELRERKLDNQCLVQFQAMFSTRVDGDGPDAIERLRIQRSVLTSAIQSWGSADATDAVGDPLLGVTATLPGVMPKQPSPVACAPLPDALSLLPLVRPASPWTTGSMPLRSPDGKLMPYTPGSSRQASWVDITVAAMGGGKSVMLNTINLAFVLAPGLSEIPYLSIIDIGPSSRGLVDLLRNYLPPAQRHYAAYHRLRMVPEHAINPCDTPTGCHIPLPMHLGLLINLLSLLATPLDRTAPPDGITGLARTCIERAYDDLGPEHHPRLFEPAADPRVAEAVRDAGMHIDAHTSWWEVVDALFSAGKTHEATLAQRFAVPRLGEIAAVAITPEVSGIYGDKVIDGEQMPKFFWRSVVDAIGNWPIFGGPTRFDLGEARIVSLDLDEVAPRGSAAADRQTAVMYMLARYVCADRFFLSVDDARMMPEQYRAHHARIAEKLVASPKRLCIDEFHRVRRAGPVLEQITNDIDARARESRKWNLHMSLISQSIDDFPPALLDIATSFYVLAGSAHAANHITEKLALPPGSAEAIEALRPPGPGGAEMVASFITTDGRIVQRLVNTLGPMLLWGFSTTAEDRAVRDRLCALIDPGQVLKLLATKYPGGIKREVERRRVAMETQNGAPEDVIDTLVREIADSWKPA